MKIIREVQNVIDGKYKIREKDTESQKPLSVTPGFREDESQVVRKLLDLGLALPKQKQAKQK